jgi:hypothetical protein
VTTPNRYPRTMTLDEIERIAHTTGDLTTLDLLERMTEELGKGYSEEEFDAEYNRGFKVGYTKGHSDGYDSAFGEDDPS